MKSNYSTTPFRTKITLLALAFLVLAQLSWWIFLFLNDGNQIAALQRQLNQVSEASIQKELVHRYWMFLSEAITFAILLGVGFCVLYSLLVSLEKHKVIETSLIEVVSHESKTPLTSLKLRLESMLEAPELSVEIRDHLKTALVEVRRLSMGVEKVLNVVRMDQQVYQFEAVCPRELIHGLIRRLEPWMKSSSVEIKMDYSDNLPDIRADVQSLQSSVQCLIENAVHYHDKNIKNISLSVLQKDRQVLITVADNGPGIDIDDKARIFEKYYRGKSVSKLPGSGLGLFLVKKVVEAHGGKVVLTSELGEGTRVTLELRAFENSI